MADSDGLTLGMNPAEVRDFARAADAAASRLSDVRSTLTGRLQHTTWTGPDAASFRSSWTSAHAAALARAVEQLVDAARTARENADAQERASAADDGSAVTGAGHLGTSVPGASAIPPDGGTPAQNRDWWNALTPAQQQAILRDHPERVGNLDGVPMAVRDEANRARLPDELAALRADEPPAYLTSPRGAVPNPAHAEWEKQVQALENAQAELAENPELSLLLLNVGDPRVDVALAVGDVDTADHVGVYTQGLFSNTGNKDDIHNAVQQITRVDALVRRDLAYDGRRDETHAMVVWMGYDSPQNVIDVLSDRQAKAGATSLASFADGIKAVNSSTSLVGLGHSYGSTVTGLAAQQTDAFDSVVVFGSPGLGTDDAHDLKVPAGRVYALGNPDDPVANSGHFNGSWWPVGTPAAQIPGVTELSTAEHGDLKGPTPAPVSAHDIASGFVAPLGASTANLANGLFNQHGEYLVDRSTAEYNIAAAVAGTPDRMIK